MDLNEDIFFMGNYHTVVRDGPLYFYGGGDFENLHPYLADDAFL